MVAAAKFLFDNDFGGGAEGKPTMPVAEHLAKLKEAEEKGYHKGFAEAQVQALQETGRLTAAALERLAGAFAHFDDSLRSTEAKLETEAVEVAVAVGRKLASALVEREPFAEIAALASECFRQLVVAPHVVVRVNDALYAATRDNLDDILRSRGFEGRLVVLAEPEVAPGDCRIEWADGGVNRDSAAADKAIGEAVARYIAARRDAAHLNDTTGRSSS